MDIPSPGWRIGVVSGSSKSEKAGDLSTALLYADEVIWLPTKLPFLTLLKYQLSLTEKIPGMREVTERLDLRELEEERTEVKYYQSLIRDISSGNLPIILPPNWQIDDNLSKVDQALDERLTSRFEALLERSGTQVNSPEEKEHLKRWSRNFLQTRLFEHIRDSIAPDVRATLLGEHEGVAEAMKRMRACIIDLDSPYALQRPLHWNPNQAAQKLMEALSKVLLPDVASLPLLEVAELRERVKDELNPMRGELLRLTETLRSMVKDECSEEEVAREAENIIKTRIESVLFEADRHIKDQLNNRWNKFLKGTLRTIAFVGAGNFAPDLTKEAFKEVLGTTAEAIMGRDQVRLPVATAQFVLQIRHYYSEKYRY